MLSLSFSREDGKTVFNTNFEIRDFLENFASNKSLYIILLVTVFLKHFVKGCRVKSRFA